MKILAPVAFASVLLLSACATAPQTPTGSASTTHNYRCESGQTIAASYPTTDSATVQYKGESHNMAIAVSASGSRYVGGEMEWWTKGSGTGSEGTLFRHMADSTTGEVIERCTAI
ncbi:MliC family protein [Lysobacter sp. A03]|uniref:MliC family protein n=1 Tax=Lysobacter sp. A03 TaxID=1199154 RepID=UPI0005B712E3|nr:MliC family protein [Lysobacter sp. A03]KIQ96692.1 Periplasmic lysozyme inhibitor of c-type lysozyme [Lysobacter sp. A03]